MTDQLAEAIDSLEIKEDRGFVRMWEPKKVVFLAVKTEKEKQRFLELVSKHSKIPQEELSFSLWFGDDKMWFHVPDLETLWPALESWTLFRVEKNQSK